VEKILMSRYDFFIINRSFWPIYPVIGESLLQLAENLSSSKKIAVVTQDHIGIKKKLKNENRGAGVNFFLAWALSSSSSNIFVRVLDSIFFMFWVIICLIIARPKNIYISTDPPILIPFITTIYAKLFNARLVYHVQDIHPEATSMIIKLNSLIFFLLKKIDIFTMKNADLLITLTNEMKTEVINRSNTKKKILLMDNPSISFRDNLLLIQKIKGFSFTGNLGRLQKIPLLLEAIDNYNERGGKLKFFFAGGGVYANLIFKKSKTNSLISYQGILSSKEAALLSSKYEWALLPIEDKVTRFAFPSKTSSYVFSGAKIFAICGADTSVANWVRHNNLGVVITPNTKSIVDFFFKIEKEDVDFTKIDIDRKELKQILHIDKFVKNLESAIFYNVDHE
jgi:hypothetical protein